MSAPKFLDVVPVVAVTDMKAAIRFYSEKLGFRLLFTDPADIDLRDPEPVHPSYAVLGRDEARIHIQSHDPANPNDRVEPIQIRFLIDDVDGLYTEYQSRGAIVLANFSGRTLADTPWGTREFGLYDLDRNGLFFYRIR